MKNFIRNNGLWILFAAAVISVVLAVMSLMSSSSSPLVNLAGILTAPFRSAYTAVADWVEEKQDYFADNQALRQENQELREDVSELGTVQSIVELAKKLLGLVDPDTVIFEPEQ